MAENSFDVTTVFSIEYLIFTFLAHENKFKIYLLNSI